MSSLILGPDDTSIPALVGLDVNRAQLILLRDRERRRNENRLKEYWPYPKQARFHRLGAEYRERLLIAANQVGKTWSAAYEVAMHMTGRYPTWWKGKRLTRSNHWIAGSESSELTKKGVQRLLLGRDIKTAWGTGAIPKDAVAYYTPGTIPGLAGTVYVKHENGGELSTISFKSYDQGREKWQADTVDGVWFDEEPPEDIYTEGLTRTNMTMGPIILTFTPLNGMSKVVKRFLIDKLTGTVFVVMTLEDAEHYTPEQRRAIEASYPEHEREARAHGNPLAGAGLCFPIKEEIYKEPQIDVRSVPRHWRRISGIDFGWEHPTAGAWLLYDPDTDCLHLYDCYRQSHATPVVHAAAFKARGSWIPVAWPQDGLQHEKGTGVQLQAQYRKQGLRMLNEPASFESTNTERETNTSLVSVEAGISELLDRMKTGRFKAAAHLSDFWEEVRMYHRKDGQIVKINEDIISAVRYATMMLRYAIPAPEDTAEGFTRVRPNWRA